MSTPIDMYRDVFLKFIADGMTYDEALDQFDEDEWFRASMEEVFTDQARIDVFGGGFVTNDERKLPALFALSCRAHRQRTDTREMQEQAIPLYMAGWTSEVPECFKNNSADFWRQCPVMSLYWRAPSKLPGKPGRRYLSTNQAYRAMMKAQQPKP